MPKWLDKISKYNPGEKSLKATFAIYLDSECLLKKLEYCQNNPRKSYTEKKAKHESSGWTMFTTCSFELKDHCYYTGKFRGAAHSKCNLIYKVPKDIPIIIHNTSYDFFYYSFYNQSVNRRI